MASVSWQKLPTPEHLALSDPVLTCLCPGDILPQARRWLGGRGTFPVSRTWYVGTICNSTNAFSVYPNPADETVEISAAEKLTDESEETNQAAASPFEVELYNIVGEQKLKGKTKQKGEKLKLNVKHLPEGVYILHIINPEGVVQKQLQIQR